MKPRYRLTGSSIINALGAVVIVSLVISLAQTVHRNYQLGRQINDLKGETELLKEQRDELSYNIQYYKTDSFRDREARAKLGLQLPGENVVIIPSTAPKPGPAPLPGKTNSKQSNLQQWFDFLGGRS
jgi:cell division protein FtsB